MTLSTDTSLQSTVAKQDRRQVTFITLAACLIFWVFVFADSGWGPILTPLSTQFHISLATVGPLYVVWSTGYLPGALVGGAMLDRYGPRAVLFTASLIVLGGMFSVYLGLLLPQLTPFVALLIIAGLAGTGGGVIDATTNGLISSVFARRRGMALNLFNLLYPLGGVVIALIDAGLFKLFNNDPRPPFLFTLCFIGVALFSLLGIPKTYTMEGEESASVEREAGHVK
jgi:MFS family permease